MLIDITIDETPVRCTDIYEIERYNDTVYRFYQLFGRYPDAADRKLGLERLMGIQSDLHAHVRSRRETDRSLN